MTMTLTTEQLVKLSAQVEEQLAELESSALMRKDLADKIEQLSKQRKAIEGIVKDNVDSFLQKFTEKSKGIICDANSDLHKQYDAFGGLKKDEVLDKFAALLASDGIFWCSIERVNGGNHCVCVAYWD